MWALHLQSAQGGREEVSLSKRLPSPVQEVTLLSTCRSTLALPHTSSSSAGCRASGLLQASKDGEEWMPRGGDALLGVQALRERLQTRNRFRYFWPTPPLPSSACSPPECSAYTISTSQDHTREFSYPPAGYHSVLGLLLSL